MNIIPESAADFNGSEKKVTVQIYAKNCLNDHVCTKMLWVHKDEANFLTHGLVQYSAKFFIHSIDKLKHYLSTAFRILSINSKNNL